MAGTGVQDAAARPNSQIIVDPAVIGRPYERLFIVKYQRSSETFLGIIARSRIRSLKGHFDLPTLSIGLP
jgi:hypothetical protein